MKKNLVKRFGIIFSFSFCLIAMTIFLNNPAVLAQGGGGGGGGGGAAMGGIASGAMIGSVSGYGGLMYGASGGYGGFGGLMYGGFGGLMYGGSGGYFMTNSAAANSAAMLGIGGGTPNNLGFMNPAAVMAQTSLMSQSANALMSQTSLMTQASNALMNQTSLMTSSANQKAYQYGSMFANQTANQQQYGYMYGNSYGPNMGIVDVIDVDPAANVAAGIWGPTLGGASGLSALMNQYQFMNQYQSGGQYNMPW